MSGDNYRREVGKLKRRVGVGSEPEACCPTCGQGVTKAGAAAIEARRKETGESARRSMIAFIEEVAERQRLASERAGRKMQDDADLREAGKVARERARRAPVVPELSGADVRPQEDETERAVRARLSNDEVLKVLKQRQEQRRREREEREASPRQTVTNNRGGEE
jgi:hypothetical protein